MKNPFKKGEPDKPPAQDMSLVDHLGELRTRLIRSVIAVVLGAILVWFFFDPIFDFLSEPYCDLQSGELEELAEEAGVEGDACRSFLITDPLEPFSVQLTLAGYGGLILALPVILYQLGRFVMPGLYPNEKKALIPFFIVAILLLGLGMTVAYLFLPRALDVLVNDFGSDRFEALFSPSRYLSFFVKMILAFGLAFELPLVLVFLQMVGAVKTATLRKNRRIAVVLVIILGAIITPTGDPFTLLVLSLPMYLFYELSMIIGGRLTKNRLDVV